MKKINIFIVCWGLFLFGLLLLLGCTTTNSTCNDYGYSTRNRYQYNTQHRTTPTCIGNECSRYQYKR